MMHHTAFHTSLPRRDESCVVFASPHSGSNYPADLMAKTVLSDHMVRSSEDAFVDQLVDCAEDGCRLLLVRRMQLVIDAPHQCRMLVDIGRDVPRQFPELIQDFSGPRSIGRLGADTQVSRVIAA